MKFDVHDLVGEHAITLDDGQRVFDLIHPTLAAGHPVELDFSRVSIYASPFFNAAIGQLLRDLKSDELNRLLKMEGLNPVGRDVARRVIENSKQYYSATEDYRKAQHEVLERLARES
jgi:STAS-like domain of unknown function (DUF4325)